MNICHNCQHLEKLREPRVWYNYLCGAIRFQPVQNPVTGNVEYTKPNGTRSRHPHPYCRDFNLHGDCDMFKPA